MQKVMSEFLKVIIADDEKYSRELIQDYLNRYCQNIEILALAKDANEAVSLINQHKPDLVFLDVEMPFGNAFDVLERTAEVDYSSIFITAYDDYAIKALNYSAAYYILKPVSIEELVNAVEKVRNLMGGDDAARLRSVLKSNIGGIERIVLPNQNGFDVVNTEDIICISGNGNYSDIYLTSGIKKTVSKVLKYFVDLEGNNSFIRVHKSHIVNLAQVKAYKKGRGGFLVMNNDREVEVSINKKKEVLGALGL
jgi:two-component system LytT family response regulator